MKDAQSSDYLARVPVYVIGPGNAHILFSATNDFNQKGSVYEICMYTFESIGLNVIS